MKLFSLLLLATGISASLVGRQGNSQCAQWCAANFPNPGLGCTSLAAKGQGPCYQCGPAAATPGASILCSGQCVPSDVNNCGTCGNVCPIGASCNGGTCACPAGQSVCNGRCVDLNWDNNNCGACGNVCSDNNEDFDSDKCCYMGVCTDDYGYC